MQAVLASVQAKTKYVCTEKRISYPGNKLYFYP